jgi:hypothetical protein
MPELYKHFQPAPGAEGAPEGAAPEGAAPEAESAKEDDDVIDADFEMVDEDKK